MRVEACCQDLLTALLPQADPQRLGLCLDVGVGTFAFYCEQFAQLGYQTWAIEPLPVAKLRDLARGPNLKLLELCLSDQDGSQTLYVGSFAGLFNSNFSSLAPGWFGSSGSSRQVMARTLASLLAAEKPCQVTCLKLDIEGWEWHVIKQLPQLDPKYLPKIIMFEYGGGSSKQKSRQGWSREFYQQTLDCLQILKDCGYGESLRVDFAPGSRERFFNLQSLSFLQDGAELFGDNCIYGNIISTLDLTLDPAAIAALCRPHYRVTPVEWLVNWLVSL